jgi:ABC-2 type transport system permease protein
MAVIVAVGIFVPAPYGLQAPDSAAGFILFLLTLFSGFLLASAYCMLVTAIRLGITWGDGPMHMLLFVSGILSGSYLPLQLWPDSWQTALYLQPFAGFMDLPVRFYIGSIPPSAAAGVILVQMVWTTVFIIAGRLIMAKRIKNLIVQGG